MQTVVIVIHLMIVLAMIGFVMLQRSEGGGLGTGSAGSSGFLSSRGTANVLTRTTAFLAIGFFITSLLLSALAGMDRKPASILQGGSTAVQAPAGGGDAPLAPPGGSLLDSLGGSRQPSGPQVPQSR